jgi:hypothetical protein
MTETERLAALEDIKALKARYWLGVDTRDGDLLRSVFADDAMIPVQEGSGRDRAPEAFIENLLTALAGATSLHLGGSPLIEFQSATEATGIWTLEDRIWAPDGSKLPFKVLHGWGHYHDRYRRTDDGWKIAWFFLKRVRVEATPA